MLIYNITINIQEKIQEEWLIWVKEQISNVLETGCFISAKLTQVLVKEEMGGYTYSVQFTCPNRESLEKYYKNYAPEFRKREVQRFGSKVVTFRTELEIIEEFFSVVAS